MSLRYFRCFFWFAANRLASFFIDPFLPVIVGFYTNLMFFAPVFNRLPAPATVCNNLPPMLKAQFMREFLYQVDRPPSTFLDSLRIDVDPFDSLRIHFLIRRLGCTCAPLLDAYEYIGHTAQKTREQLKKAYGGILFIDEAYSLSRGGEKDFGKEAIDCLVKAMEDHKNEFILILAGYQKEMEGFLQTNPGLRSRFPIHVDFPDYNQKELLQIADQMCQTRQYRFSNEAQEAIIALLQTYHHNNWETFGNARTVRNLIERAIRRQAVRLINKNSLTRQELMMLEASDILEVK